MGRRRGRGALIGFLIAALGAFLLTCLPVINTGDFYEFVDPLVSMGLPMVALGTVLGASVGMPPKSERRPTSADEL